MIIIYIMQFFIGEIKIICICGNSETACFGKKRAHTGPVFIVGYPPLRYFTKQGRCCWRWISVLSLVAEKERRECGAIKTGQSTASAEYGMRMVLMAVLLLKDGVGGNIKSWAVLLNLFSRSKSTPSGCILRSKSRCRSGAPAPCRIRRRAGCVRTLRNRV